MRATGAEQDGGGDGDERDRVAVVGPADPDDDAPMLSDDDVAWGLAGEAGPEDQRDDSGLGREDDDPVGGAVRLLGTVERRGPAGGRRTVPGSLGRQASVPPVRRRPGTLAEAAELARPTTLAEERTLPVLVPLATLLPDGALPRGVTVIVDGGPGATSLALALLAGPSRAGAWVAVVGLDGLGLAAAAEVGIDLERLLLVAEPPDEVWGAVVATLVGAVDVVVVAPRSRVRAGDARRLTARQRERGTVLVAVGGDAVAVGVGVGAVGGGVGLDVDIRLTVTGRRWSGLEFGYGHLRACRVEAEAGGRRRAARPRRAALWLPDAEGRVTVAEGVVAEDATGPVPLVPNLVAHRRRAAG